MGCRIAPVEAAVRPAGRGCSLDSKCIFEYFFSKLIIFTPAAIGFLVGIGLISVVYGTLHSWSLLAVAININS